jgi:hypothetical protein
MNRSGQFLEVQSTEELNSAHPLPPAIVSDKLSSLVVLQLCENNGVRHVIQRSNLLPDLETKVARFMLEQPHKFILAPVSSILEADAPSEITEKHMADFRHEIGSPHCKDKLIEDLREYAKKFKNPSSFIYDLSIVAGELMSNAIYNAPYVDEMNSHSGPDRNPSNIVVDQDRKPVIFAGSDGVRLVVGVKDFYGRLHTANLIQKIRRCYENNLGDQISYKEGGAGIGAFMIFDSCAGFYVAVENGRSTTICCSIPLNMSANKRSSLPKNIHFLNV